MKFIYQAVDAQGQRRSDTVEAPDRESAVRELTRRGLQVLNLVPVPGGSGVESRLGAVRKQVERQRESLQQATQEVRAGEARVDALLDEHGRARLGLRDLLLFTSQLNVLLTAGIPLVPALDALGGDDEKGAVAEGLATHLGRGNRLSASMARYPRVFDQVYVRMVHLAEQSGRLAEVFGSLARTLQLKEESQGRLARALIYPAVLLCFSLGITGFLFCYMLPRFLETFKGFGLQLPTLTRAMLFLFERPLFTWGVPALVVTLGVTVVALREHPRMVRARRWAAFNLPVLGRLHRTRALAQVCSDLAMMVGQGVPLTMALELLVGTTGSTALDASLTSARLRLEAGQTLAESLEEAGFSRLLVSTVAAAEPTGELDRFLQRLAELLSLQADTETEQALTLVEPLILGVLGVIVGGVVLAVFLPVYQLATFSPS